MPTGQNPVQPTTQVAKYYKSLSLLFRLPFLPRERLVASPISAHVQTSRRRATTVCRQARLICITPNFELISVNTIVLATCSLSSAACLVTAPSHKLYGMSKIKIYPSNRKLDETLVCSPEKTLIYLHNRAFTWKKR